MFEGHILQAKTNIGSIFSSPTICIKIVSARQKGLSGKPILTFSRVTRIKDRNEHKKYAKVENANIFVKLTFLSFLLNTKTEKICPKA